MSGLRDMGSGLLGRCGRLTMVGPEKMFKDNILAT